MPTSAQPSPSAAAAEDVPALAAALARAFLDDPVFDWLLPAGRREARLRRFFALELRALVLPRGRAWTTAGGDPLAGVALELPPGAWRMPAGVVARHARALAAVFGGRLWRATGLLGIMERRHVREPHVYVPYVGVPPERQGRGLGTTLLRAVLDRADAVSLPVYLEATCERNAALYERLAFRRLAALRFGASPPLLPMLRAPHAD
jgi:GNAT superfamily N-acetyltransferase